MRALVLWADDESPNLGVRVLGAGTAELIRRVYPEADIVPVSYGLDTAPMRVGDWKTLAKERLSRKRGLLDWLSQFDLAVDTRAGDSFADIYGIERLATMSMLAEWTAQAGVPVVMGPQTIGPFTTRSGAALAKFSMARAKGVIARDSASATAARSLGVRPIESTDVVFALPVLEGGVARDVVLNVSGLLWTENPHVDYRRYQEIIRSLIRRLLGNGREVTLLAHVLDSSTMDNDVPTVSALADEFAADGVGTLVPTSLNDVRRELAAARVVLGSRMHACLNAISSGTPAVPLAYSRKFEPLLRDLGWYTTINLRTDDSPVDRVMTAISTLDGAGDVAETNVRANTRLLLAEQALKEVVAQSTLVPITKGERW